MTIIIDMFFGVVFVVFFMRSLFAIGKVLNSNQVKKNVTIFIAVAIISAITIISIAIDILQQIVQFVGSL